MAGLQRFITYINKYENDEKQDGAGFAKIEIRGSTCRVEVHIRNISMEQTKATVYLFARKNGIMQGIPVGSMEIIRGSSDVRYAFDIKEIQNFGTSMHDMQGIFIPFGEKTYLASQWKEGEISGSNFEILNKQEEIGPEIKNSAAGEGANIQKRMVQENLNQTKRNVQLQNPAAVERQQDIVPQEQPKEKNEADDYRRDEIVLQKDRESQDTPLDTHVPKSQDAVQNSLGVHPQSAEVKIQNGFTIQKDTPATRDEKMPAPAPQEKRNIYTTELPLEEFREETGWERIFQKFRLKSEICFPFEGQEIECIRMGLNDLREFPQKYWYLGKNSFLLHGFFNYRHILFGQMKENGETKYFLGIPGVFQNQERMMASMFGFPGFRLAKAAEFKTGSFGYWYRVI